MEREIVGSKGCGREGRDEGRRERHGGRENAARPGR
jgi:hypothetical protein